MNKLERDIADFHKSQKQSVLGQINGVDELTKNEVGESIRETLQKSENSEDFLKGFGADLEKRFPNGSWKTVGGSKVFINNGKVVAGLDGFNKEIDKFFEQKKKNIHTKEGLTASVSESMTLRKESQSSKRVDDKIKESNLSGSEKSYVEKNRSDITRAYNKNPYKSIKDHIKDHKLQSERSQKEIGEAKQKIADTMPKPINEMTWEEFKPYGVKMQKESSHSQPESFYERHAKMEHDWAKKNNKSQYQVTDKQKVKTNTEDKKRPVRREKGGGSLKNKPVEFKTGRYKVGDINVKVSVQPSDRKKDTFTVETSRFFQKEKASKGVGEIRTHTRQIPKSDYSGFIADLKKRGGVEK